MAFDATSKTGNQYLHTGRGPLDPKSVVQTYAQLTDAATWTVNNTVIAYNGMITAVWLDPDSSKNGVYFLHDSEVKNIYKAPTVTNPSNWHKLGEIESLPGLSEQITAIQEELVKLQNSTTVVANSKADFPEEGLSGRIYVSTEEAMTFVWHEGNYLPVGDGGGDSVDIQIICGGDASGN